MIQLVMFGLNKIILARLKYRFFVALTNEVLQMVKNLVRIDAFIEFRSMANPKSFISPNDVPSCNAIVPAVHDVTQVKPFTDHLEVL